jgi:hypothetical protein
MASSPPSKTVVNFIKTTNSATRLRKQYSVEVIDLQHLAALGCVELPHSGDACSEPMRTGGKHQQDISRFIKSILLSEPRTENLSQLSTQSSPFFQFCQLNFDLKYGRWQPFHALSLNIGARKMCLVLELYSHHAFPF